ncbi:MAG: flagellar motor protein MotB [Gammaproteobacteria bacterium]|nr:flagellar motor protein MotB [Gammaproteobacteria bacterium]
MAENAQPIIVKKVKKSAHGHHGGAWKVAYADFVTAMMAFFLLLWLLNVSDPETRGGIAAYFNDPSIVHAAGGASTSVIEIGKNVDMARGEGEKMRDSQESDTAGGNNAQQAELQQLLDLKESLEQLIESSPSMMPFKEQIILDINSEGLRIQITDKENRPMFDLGGAQMKSYTRKIFKEIAPILQQIPNKVSISGHTDALQFFSNDNNYSNWELSADRANEARRTLINYGVPTAQVARVMGMADKAPYDSKNPTAAVNRRISIVVLNAKAEQSIYRQEGGDGAITVIPAILPKELKEAIKRDAMERSGTIQR